ncbi:MAG: ATP-binding protein [Cyanobacteria bacterium J06635_1]
MSSQKPTFTTKVASAFLILALFTVATVGGVAYVRARQALKEAAFDRLRVTATLKQNEINRWLESCEQDFLIIARFPDVSRQLQQLLATPSEPDRTVYDSLSNYLLEIRSLKPKFAEISIVDRSNRIILSTDKAREGKYEIATNLTYFETVIAGDKFTPVFYVSPETGKPAVTYASPVRDRTGKRIGLVMADLNLNRIDQIVRERSGLGDTGETYVVGSLAEKTSFISRHESVTRDLPNEPSSQGINEAMQGLSGEDLYANYAGVPVLGVYSWLNDQNLALIVEMSQDEAFSPARQLAGAIVIVGLGSAGALLLGVTGLARQLSQSRSQLENYSRQLEQKAQEANAANLAKSEFLANMSHELRTPLNAILGFTQLMGRDRDLRTYQLERVNIINRSGEHLLALINDVLSMSKIEAGRTLLNETRFDLHQLLVSLEEMLLIKADAKGLQLGFEVGAAVPQYVEADQGKLRQVLLNLLGNAIKFTEQGKVLLQISAQTVAQSAPPAPSASPAPPAPSPPSYKITFKVQDTGPGIAPEELDHLFDPFYQSAQNPNTQQGTGLGLAISQRFIQLMGGDITVQNRPPHGATFVFDILAKPTLAVALPQTVPSQRVTGLAPNQPDFRILVVEDADDSRRLLVELLSSVGFSIREAANGQAAVDLWQTWQPHLIWMDMRMPVMDGYEATRQIRAAHPPPTTHHPSPIIIALTASAFEEERTAVLASGCNDFVRKPFQEQTIFAAMAHHLGVQYTYAGELSDASAKREETGLRAEDLAKMPQPWICRLHRAAVQVDAEHIKQLIQQMPPQHAVISTQLLTLTENFEFDTIITLTEEIL